MNAWWKESVVYQIYPRSFADSNADGIGDLRGIIQKLDYLKELGVDVVWLSPIYQSPNDDMGYDISDYRALQEVFGSLADWEEMLAEMHKRGIKLVMDLVVNHTSDEHPWFVESRKSKDNPYRDYYIWRPGKDGHEPNNWKSHFSPSAWEYDPATGEYYLHLFSRKQPDLNWENPKVRAEVYDLMHWWLKKGIDGFRMDVINMISKVPGLPDAPLASSGRYQEAGMLFCNGPRLLEFLGEMKREVLSKYNILTVGETPRVDPEYAVKITNEETGFLNMLFQFEHMGLDRTPGGWSLPALKRTMSRWQTGLEGRGWNSNYFSNHDQPRPVSRFGNDGPYRLESAKLLGTLNHLLQGTPYIYQGEELGMTNVAFPSISDYNDIETLNMYRELTEEKGMAPQAAMAVIHIRSRDNARTPMHWNAGPQAGFTTGTPWIKVNPNYTSINAVEAMADQNSVFHYYQHLVRLRKENPTVVYGRYDLLLPEHAQIYAFTRTWKDDRLLVILNFSKEPCTFELPDSVAITSHTLLLSNYPAPTGENLRSLGLRPYEALVYQLK